MSINPFDLLPDDFVDDDDHDLDEIDDTKADPATDDAKSKKRVKKKGKKYEYEFRTNLNAKLDEMDLMGDGKLDMADFSTALMGIIKDDTYDSMAIGMRIFDDEGLEKDDMEGVRIPDIIEFLINGDDEFINLRKLICEGLKIEYNENPIEDELVNGGDNVELVELELKEREKNDEPYKPVYQITNGIQRFGNKKSLNKNKNENKNDGNGNDKKEEDEDHDQTQHQGQQDTMTSITITKTFDENEILDRIHVYLFHAVHDVKQIPL